MLIKYTEFVYGIHKIVHKTYTKCIISVYRFLIGKGHREWDNNAISYKIDESPAVITFIEVEHQKRLSARYFIEKLCSLIASTGASLQLIKMDESRGVIGNRKRIRNEVRVEALVIKETDFNAVATS